MIEQKVAGSKKSTRTRVRISDLSEASAPEYDTEMLTVQHYVQRNQLPSIKHRVCNIICGYISLNQFQRVSYVTGLHNRSQLFFVCLPHLPLVLLFFQAVFRLPSFGYHIPVFNTYGSPCNDKETVNTQT